MGDNLSRQNGTVALPFLPQLLMADRKKRPPTRVRTSGISRYLPSYLHRGFNAIEMTVVLGIIAVTAGVVVPVYYNYQAMSDLNIGVEHIVQSLRNAKTYAQSNKANTTWGVYVPTGTMFTGTVYALRNPANDVTFAVPQSLDTFGIDELYFSQIDGLPNVTGTITVRSNDLGKSRDIRIDENGFITLGDLVDLPNGTSSSPGGSSGSNGSSGSQSSVGSVGSSGSNGSIGSTSSTASSTGTASSGGNSGGSSVSSVGSSRSSSTGQSSSASVDGGGSSVGSTGSASSSSSDSDDAIGCDVRFDLHGNVLVNRGTSDITLKVLGSEITYGAGGPRVAVRVTGSTNGGIGWQDLFGGRPVIGGEEQVISNVPDGTPLALTFNGTYSWLFNRSYRSDVHTNQILILRSGDKLPNVVPFDSQKTLSALMAHYVDQSGHIIIGPKDVIFLVELGTLNTSSADFQDAVVLATFNEKSSSCTDPSKARMKISFNRFENQGAAHADRLITVGPQALSFAEEQWIPLVDPAGNVIVDNGILHTDNGLSIERGNGWVRVLQSGGQDAKTGMTIVDARALFNHVYITSIDNGTGSDATESPRDGIINDGANGDEFVDGPNAKSMTFSTRVNTGPSPDNDSVILHWKVGEVSDTSSSSSSAGSTGSNASVASTGSSASSSDVCAVPFHVDTDGTLVTEATSDVTLKIAGSYGTYGERGPQIGVRTRISFDDGTTWQPLFDYRILKGGEVALFHNVPTDSHILLDFDGRYSWVFHQTAQSNIDDGHVRVARNGQVVANVPALLDRGSLRGFFGTLLTSGARANIGTHDVLFAVEMSDIDDTADYQDAVVVLSIDKPAGTAGCGQASSVSSSAQPSSTSSSASSQSSMGSSVSSSVNGNADTDGDGVLDKDDLCSGTVIPESVPTSYLGFSRFALTKAKKGNAKNIFRTGPTKSVGAYSIDDIRGCSCAQLLEAVDGKNTYRFTETPSLLLVMQNLFPFYSQSSRQFGCPDALMRLVSDSR